MSYITPPSRDLSDFTLTAEKLVITVDKPADEAIITLTDTSSLPSAADKPDEKAAKPAVIAGKPVETEDTIPYELSKFPVTTLRDFSSLTVAIAKSGILHFPCCTSETLKKILMVPCPLELIVHSCTLNDEEIYSLLASKHRIVGLNLLGNGSALTAKGAEKIAGLKTIIDVLYLQKVTTEIIEPLARENLLVGTVTSDRDQGRLDPSSILKLKQAGEAIIERSYQNRARLKVFIDPTKRDACVNLSA